MISAWLSFLARWVVIAVLGTALIALGIPLLRVNRAWRAMARSEALIESGRAAEAARALAAVEETCTPYPDVCTSMRLQFVRAQVAAGDLRGARATAEAVYRDFGTPRFPESALRPALSIPAPYVVAILRLNWNPGLISKWSGFDVLLDELSKSGNRTEAALLAADLAGRGPDPAFAQTLAVYQTPVAIPAPAPPRRVQPVQAKPGPDHNGVPGRPDPEAAPSPNNGPAADADGGTAPVRAPASPEADAGWAIVKSADARAFTMEGKFLRALPEFFVVSVSGARESRSGRLAACSDPSSSFAPAGFLMKEDDLSVFDSPFSELGEEAASLVAERSSLALRLLGAKNLTEETLRARNPYRAEYDRALDAWTRHGKEVATLTKKRDESTGDERLKAMDALRLMISSGTERGNALSAAKQKYDRWMAEQRPRFTSREVASLDRRISEITDALRGMGLP